MPARPDSVQLRARHSSRLVIIGVMCACLGALLMAWAWTSAQASQSVVIMTHDVFRGEKIEDSNLGTTTLGRAEGVRSMPSEQLSELVGKYALVDLPAGSLPGSQSVENQIIPTGMAHLGLRLGPGQIPAAELAPGTRVWLIALPASGDSPTESGKQYEATLSGATQMSASSAEWLVDVYVTEPAAGDVARLAAAERIAVVRRGES